MPSPWPLRPINWPWPVAEIGSIAERRIALLVDTKMSGLPAYLVKNSGLNSGFMVAQVTAAALVAENKALAHPCSVDSIPTSANQEDHVSMAAHAARRLLAMAGNAEAIVGIELLAAAQGLEFHRPLKSSAPLELAHQQIRRAGAPMAEPIATLPQILLRRANSYTVARWACWWARACLPWVSRARAAL